MKTPIEFGKMSYLISYHQGISYFDYSNTKFCFQIKMCKLRLIKITRQSPNVCYHRENNVDFTTDRALFLWKNSFTMHIFV